MKRLMIVTLAVICAAAVLPQSLAAGFGIKGGYALSKFSVEGGGFLNLPSPVGGVFFSLKLGPLAIQPEALYVRMGGKVGDSSNRLEWRFDYIQVPVLLKFSVIPLGPIRPVIYAGGYGSYLFKARGVTVVDGTAQTPVDMSEDYQKYDYGVVGGAGIEFKLPGIMISVEGRYNYGLMNIWKPLGPDDPTSWKNRSMMALLGIGF